MQKRVLHESQRRCVYHALLCGFIFSSPFFVFTNRYSVTSSGKLIASPSVPLKFSVITPAGSVRLKVISEPLSALLPNVTLFPFASVRLGIFTKPSTVNVPPVTETSLAVAPFKVNAPPQLLLCQGLLCLLCRLWLKYRLLRLPSYTLFYLLQPYLQKP